MSVAMGPATSYPELAGGGASATSLGSAMATSLAPLMAEMACVGEALCAPLSTSRWQSRSFGKGVELPQIQSTSSGPPPSGPPTTQAEGARLNTILTGLGQLNKVGAPMGGTGTASNGELWGAFTYAWTQAGRVVHFAGESVVQTGDTSQEAGSSNQTAGTAMKTAKILRPRNVHEFYHMLSVWQMIC